MTDSAHYTYNSQYKDAYCGGMSCSYVSLPEGLAPGAPAELLNHRTSRIFCLERPPWVRRWWEALSGSVVSCERDAAAAAVVTVRWHRRISRQEITGAGRGCVHADDSSASDMEPKVVWQATLPTTRLPRGPTYGCTTSPFDAGSEMMIHLVTAIS
eukprot:TRINITY_DN18136_c0_g1_i2.p1 TRINITY_DN18136_c0_g1~~TRINITY_DN18136_c0_g1_i2.p1  ORF type:complete len:156 (-),score=19.32 TRINITY_DN18136_c0_g1_i2:187-654(-)